MGGVPGRELGWETGNEVEVPHGSWLLQHLQPQACSLSQHPQQPIPESSFCVDYEILIACPPRFNCIWESAKLSQYEAAWLPFAPRRTEKLEKQEYKRHIRSKQRVEVGGAGGACGDLRGPMFDPQTHTKS